ncbi:hypothetical protein QBC38DRAFT_451096 [Podospora fimiseda]|uniref:PNPLA domain-containing protein n=1 Tax=Podospora fimiseda TaxID=252190 RepID=A0AAN7H197_9PEZI|nr:hypothetical protein QBC38DRAFT_451096 [Podospora fimiseda]
MDNSSAISMVNNVDPDDLEEQIRQLAPGCDADDEYTDDHNYVKPPPIISNLSSNDPDNPAGTSRWNEYTKGWQVPRLTNEAVQKQTEFLVEEARRGLQAFRDRYWRCEAMDSSGRRRCKNYSRSHDKGHQFDYHDGKSQDSPSSSTSDIAELYSQDLESGQYQSSYDPETYEQLWEEIGKIRALDSDLIIETLARAARFSGIHRIKRQRTCSPARKPNMAYAKTTPWYIRVKPKTAGPRILTLDGGGIRGIIQLVILSEIERTIGLRIPIQEFFDLVIAAGSGSIVALGVFVKGWTVDGAIERFTKFSENAFALRTALRVFSKLAEPFCDYKYKEASLENAVKKTFSETGDRYLFGQSSKQTRKGQGERVKVGIVTSQEGRHGPCLIANYSRNPVSKSQNGKTRRIKYDWLQREDEQAKDFRIWQTTIKNPISLALDELRRIWTSELDSHIPPDIMLSIGTGIQVDGEGNPTDSRPARLKKMKDRVGSRVREAIDTGLDTVGTTLACHDEWVDFQSRLRPGGRLESNSHRLNIGLSAKPPRLDAFSDIITSLSSYTTMSEHITAVARRLMASVFYLEDLLSRGMPGGEHENVIHCRLAQSEGTLSLLALRPKFRALEVPAQGSSGDVIINDIIFLNGTEDPDFDYQTLSARVKF